MFQLSQKVSAIGQQNLRRLWGREHLTNEIVVTRSQTKHRDYILGNSGKGNRNYCSFFQYHYVNPEDGLADPTYQMHKASCSVRGSERRDARTEGSTSTDLALSLSSLSSHPSCRHHHQHQHQHHQHHQHHHKHANSQTPITSQRYYSLTDNPFHSILRSHVAAPFHSTSTLKPNKPIVPNAVATTAFQELGSRLFTTMSHHHPQHTIQCKKPQQGDDLADVFLLPFTFTPTLYKLKLTPDLAGYSFTGVVDITLRKEEPSNEIILNVADITIQSASFTSKDSNKTLEPVSIDIVTEDERAIFKFGETINEDGVLHIEYQGILNDKMKGFYRSEYTWKGEKKMMGVTQFEANDARRAFPCWDEPGRKAVFEVELIVDRHLDVISNMNSVSVVSDSETGKKSIVFAPTPIMSTYLLAFFVGEFDYIEQWVQCMDSKIPIRVYAPPGEAGMGTFALDVASKVLPNLEKFFGIPYPLPKMDMIAIPDFAAGAMENFGAISYRTTALLFNESSSSLSTKQWIALVVAHELGHQWFGNLASPSWWKYLYLNEAFATWLEYFQVDLIFPEWKIFNQFVQIDFSKALELDSMESSHAVEVDCMRAEDVDEIFDAISYSKGSSLLRMLVNYVGLDTFREGLKIYLQRFLYDNAASKDLWDAISEATKTDITDLMNGWTKQIGYPVVHVSEGRNSQGKRVMNVSQERFLQKGPTENSEIWSVPISYITDKNSEPTYVLLTKQSDSFEIPEDAKFVKVNSQQSGFYRVKYSEEMLPSLVEAIKSKTIEPLDRLGVLDDACALAKAGYTEAANAITIFSAFSEEDDYIVVKALVSNVVGFYEAVKRDEAIEPLFKKFGCSLFSNMGQTLGWDPKPNEDSLETLKRTIIIAALKKFGHEGVLKEGNERFKRVINKETSAVSPDLLGIVYSIGIAEGGKDAFDAVLKIYRESTLNEEKVRCISSLGSVKDLELLKSLLNPDFILKEVKAQDVMYPLQSIASNKNQGRELIWEWFTSNFDQIKQRVDNGFLFGRVLKIATCEFDTIEQRNDVEKFISQHDLPQLKRSIAQALEGIELNTEIKKRVLKSVTKEFMTKLL